MHSSPTSTIPKDPAQQIAEAAVHALNQHYRSKALNRARIVFTLSPISVVLALIPHFTR